jgi:hypothetical protein
MFRFWLRGAVVDDGERWWSVRRRALPLLQEPDVEDVMKSSSGRKCHPDGDCVDHLGHLIGAEESGLQLARRRFERRDGTVS